MVVVVVLLDKVVLVPSPVILDPLTSPDAITLSQFTVLQFNVLDVIVPSAFDKVIVEPPVLLRTVISPLLSKFPVVKSILKLDGLLVPPTWKLDVICVVTVPTFVVIYCVFPSKASTSVFSVPTSVVNPLTVVSKAPTSAAIPATVPVNAARPAVFAAIAAACVASKLPVSPLSPLSPFCPCAPCCPCCPSTNPKFKIGFAWFPVMFTVGVEPDDKFVIVPMVKLGVIPF